jgi:hypothetical protein
MLQRLYPVTWALLLILGLLLFAVAAVLEGQVLYAYLDSLWLALGLAVALEGLKVLVIVMHRFLHSQQTVRYPHTVRGVVLGFRWMLLGLSAACSLMYLAGHLDRPALEQVRGADLASAQARFQADTERERADAAARRTDALAALDAQDLREREAIAARYLPAIAALEQQLDAEMDNEVGGVFIGKRYRAIEQRLADEKAAFERARTEHDANVAARRAELLAALDGAEAAQTAARTERRDRELAAIRASGYEGDSRVEHALARAFVNTLDAVFPEPPTVLQFTFFLALFLSVTMELGIWVSFELLTTSRLPVLEAWHRAALVADSKAAETASALHGFALDGELVKARVRRKREAIEAGLRDDAEDKLAVGGPGPARAA